MDPYMLPFNVRDALLCLLFLGGMIAGLRAMNQNRKVGGLVALGFALLAIDPISEFLIFTLLSPAFSESAGFAVFNWTYACLSSLADIGGFLALLTAIFTAIRPQPFRNTSSNEAMPLPRE